ncbi:MAG: hypothetical protein ACOYIP_04335 [Coriobacteriales bacterium]
MPQFPNSEMLEMLKSAARHERPRRKLENLLALMDDDELYSLAIDFGIETPDLLGTETLIKEIAAQVKQPEVLASFAESVHGRDIDKLLDIVDRDGSLIVPEAQATFDTMMVPSEPIVYLFYEPGGFTYVIPDELVEPLGKLDWEGLRAKAQQLLGIRTLAAAAVELRGIVPMEDFIGDCRARYPELGDEEIVTQTLHGAFLAPLHVILFVDDDIFMLDPDLANAYMSSAGDGASFVPDSPFLQGPLDSILTSMLDDQSGMPPRPIPDEMLDQPVAAFWRESLPEAVEMRNWLETNAPEGQDAQQFASFALRDFVDEVKWGDVGQETVARYSKMLEDAGLKLDSAKTVDFLAVLQTFLNNQPIWPCNGWTPTERAQMNQP